MKVLDFGLVKGVERTRRSYLGDRAHHGQRDHRHAAVTSRPTAVHVAQHFCSGPAASRTTLEMEAQDLVPDVLTTRRAFGVARVFLSSSSGERVFYEHAGYRATGPAEPGHGVTFLYPYEKQL